MITRMITEFAILVLRRPRCLVCHGDGEVHFVMKFRCRRCNGWGFE